MIALLNFLLIAIKISLELKFKRFEQETHQSVPHIPRIYIQALKSICTTPMKRYVQNIQRSFLRSNRYVQTVQHANGVAVHFRV
jgi:hypothetical protein